MCGRFLIENDIEDIITGYGIRDVRNINSTRGEIFPGTNIPVVLNKNVKTLDFLRWGFKIKGAYREVINARIETLSEKLSFRKALFNNRCLIPANAFFEWETKGKSKLKYKIQVKGETLFSMAGIYDTFTDKYNNEYLGVVILTRPANEAMSKLHHRMPVILSSNLEDKWLQSSKEEVLSLQEKLEKDSHIYLDIKPAEGIKQLSLYDMM